MKVKLCLSPEALLLLLILTEERVQNKKVFSSNLVEKKIRLKDKLQRSRVTTTHCLVTKRRTNLSRNVPRRARGVETWCAAASLRFQVRIFGELRRFWSVLALCNTTASSSRKKEVSGVLEDIARLLLLIFSLFEPSVRLDFCTKCLRV